MCVLCVEVWWGFIVLYISIFVMDIVVVVVSSLSLLSPFLCVLVLCGFRLGARWVGLMFVFSSPLCVGVCVLGCIGVVKSIVSS